MGEVGVNRLPVIVAQGGISSAGRTSGFNAYKRLVFDQLKTAQQQSFLASLRALCQSDSDSTLDDQTLLTKTLIRQLHVFDPDHIPTHKTIPLLENSVLICKKKYLPNPLPENCHITPIDKHLVNLHVTGKMPILMGQTMGSEVRMAAQLPEGFSPEKTYPSRSHPRGLAMTVYGASDAIQSMGLDWQYLQSLVPADQISVYAGSSMSQLDHFSNGGLLQARLLGGRVTPKQLPLGFSEMPADFINAYIIGSLGSTGTNMGACATFLYNLKQGVADIASGRSRIVIVGNSESPLTSEILEGYAAMGALATDAGLRKLDHLTDSESIPYEKACRPFADNCGFVLGESAQFFVLMDDELALETGATILGSVGDVFINADGPKKSIASPGAGNYITLMKAVSLGKQMFGQDALNQSIVYAHGTGTPQNRVTESHILSEVAHTFNIKAWKIAAIKSHVGHSLATAAGDQLMTALGAWEYEMIPGIPSIQSIANDVYSDHLNFAMKTLDFDAQQSPVAFINAKGFGGNNATATIISPEATKKMLAHKHGAAKMSQWQTKSEAVQTASNQYEIQCSNRMINPIYRFGENVIESDQITLSPYDLTLNDVTIKLSLHNPYADFFPNKA